MGVALVNARTRLGRRPVALVVGTGRRGGTRRHRAYQDHGPTCLNKSNNSKNTLPPAVMLVPRRSRRTVPKQINRARTVCAMNNPVIDPGDPFTPGSVRWNARNRLLRAVEALLDDGGDDPPLTPRWVELREARRAWVLYGRDGE